MCVAHIEIRNKMQAQTHVSKDTKPRRNRPDDAAADALVPFLLARMAAVKVKRLSQLEM